jgi:RIO kinase 1
MCPSTYDEWDEIDPAAIRNMPSRQKRSGVTDKMLRRSNPLPAKPTEELAQQADTAGAFRFTYTASRHEAQWLVASLGEFYESAWIEDVLRLVKGGKEANVYQCQAHDSAVMVENGLLAAKVYRPRRLRNLKNDHLYREGRQDLDSDGNAINDDGMLHAIRKRTGFGRELMHTSWIEHEVKTMQVLHAAGCDVPQAFASAGNAILMSYIGDEEASAPTLSSVHLHKKEAGRLFERVLHNIELMLAHGRIHADLSAFNILYWDGAITLIDFPQAIMPGQNRAGYRIFERDVQRVCEYFTRMGVPNSPRQLAAQMWQKYYNPALSELNPAFLDPEDERDRRLWDSA